MAKQTKRCLECNNEYSTFNSKQKYCNRTCYAQVDSRDKREHYKTVQHHTVGRVVSDEERIIRSNNTRKSWLDPIIRKTRIDNQKEVRQQREFPFGWDPKSIDKRNETIKNNGGHNLKGKFGTRQCDITCFEKYGKWSYELRNEALATACITKPELLVFNILKHHDVDFISQYQFRGRYFDFGIPSKKILIEVDGIYWHGRGLEDVQLNKTQQRSRENDVYKNMLVESSDWILIRIWEDEINKFEFNKL